MAEQIVTVTIGEDGIASIDMAGFKGKGCKAVAKAFEAMGKVTKETLKPEFYQEPKGNNVITTGR